MTKYLTAKQAAPLIYNNVTGKLGVDLSRVKALLKAGRFKNAKKCECGNAWLIPEKDLKPKPTQRALRCSDN